MLVDVGPWRQPEAGRAVLLATEVADGEQDLRRGAGGEHQAPASRAEPVGRGGEMNEVAEAAVRPDHVPAPPGAPAQRSVDQGPGVADEVGTRFAAWHDRGTDLDRQARPVPARRLAHRGERREGRRQHAGQVELRRCSPADVHGHDRHAAPAGQREERLRPARVARALPAQARDRAGREQDEAAPRVDMRQDRLRRRDLLMRRVDVDEQKGVAHRLQPAEEIVGDDPHVGPQTTEKIQQNVPVENPRRMVGDEQERATGRHLRDIVVGDAHVCATARDQLAAVVGRCRQFH